MVHLLFLKHLNQYYYIRSFNKLINLLTMTNLYDLERHRLKLYGEMLKNDLLKQKEIEKMEREEKARQDKLELQRHMQVPMPPFRIRND